MTLGGDIRRVAPAEIWYKGAGAANPKTRRGGEGENERVLAMTRVIYDVVEHDGGWAYKVGDVYSETFPAKELAHAAAVRAAREQRTPGQSEAIQYEDGAGRWREETAKGNDRPETDVKD